MLSLEKQVILNDNSRVVCVNACPGSGKTRLFVERAILEIEKNIASGDKRGIVALSFTNFATDEIRKRLNSRGVSSEFPNFIGTIDSFLQHFIIQPFASTFDICKRDGISLVPAERVAHCPGWNISIKIPNEKKPIYVNECDLVIKDFKKHYCYKSSYLPYFFSKGTSEYETIKKTKKEYWKHTGQLTHNDVKCVSAILLYKYKDSIVNLLHSRFSSILVDESQDLDFLLQRVFFSIAKNAQICCFFTGDFNQNIYEDSSSKLYKQLEEVCSANIHTLSENYRCPQKHCNFAFPFMESKNRMISHNTIDGKLCLIEYSGKRSLHNVMSGILEHYKTDFSETKETAIISTKNMTLNQLSGNKTYSIPYSSKVLDGIYEAFCCFYIRDFEKAVNKMQNVFVRLLTDSTVAVNIPSILLQYGFTFASWRKLLLDTLQNTSPRKGESWECWRMRCITIFHDIVTKHFSDKSIKCGSAMSKKLKNRVAADAAEADIVIPASVNCDSGIRSLYLTIHKAKGLEFDSVIFFLPPQTVSEPNPIIQMFETGKYGIWQKACFVGFTRAMKNLYLCIHKDELDKIQALNKDFKTFFDECISIDSNQNISRIGWSKL